MNLPENKIKKEFPELIFNVGSGKEFTILELAKIISKELKFKGKIILNKSYPDGVKRKILDSSKIRKLGWKPKNIRLRIKKHVKTLQF